MRVLHVIDTLEGGGSQRWLWDIVRLTASDTSHRVIAVVPDTGADTYASRLEASGVYVQRRAPRLLRAAYEALRGPRRMGPGLRRKALGAVWLAWWLVSSSAEVVVTTRAFRPTVIHAHGFFGYLLGLFAALLTRKRLVHTVPALAAQMQDSRGSWLPWLYGRTHQLVERYFTNMPSEQIRVGIPSRKLFEIPGMVDLEEAVRAANSRAQHRADVLALIQVEEPVSLLLCVGRLHRSKGHNHAIEALAHIPDPMVHLVILGEGALQAELEQQVARSGLERRVHFVGYRDDALAFYAAADIYLRVGILEGDNMSSYPAIVMGLPVIAFDTGAETDLLPQVGHGIAVPNEDASGMALAIRDLLDHPEHSRMLGARGAAYGRTHLDLRTTIDAYQEFYREFSS